MQHAEGGQTGKLAHQAEHEVAKRKLEQRDYGKQRPQRGLQRGGV